jgi:hypothetical protein
MLPIPVGGRFATGLAEWIAVSVSGSIPQGTLKGSP